MVLSPSHCPAEHPLAADDKDFQFQLRGKIITLDHGGAFVGTPVSRNLSNLGGLITIAIDPAHTLQGREQDLWGRLIQHHHHHVALGDGTPATLYLCQDSAYSGTLAPLPAAGQQPALRQGTTVLGTQAIPTVRLDDLTGLGKVDWMILNGANDNAAILQGAQRLLPNVLAVQVQIPLGQVFEKQNDLDSLARLLAPHGFKLAAQLRRNQAGPAQDLMQDALFVPDEARIEAMSDDLRWKLAFLLHSAYNMPDMAYPALQRIDEELALRYLRHSGWLATPKVPDKPHELPGRLVVSLTSYAKRFRTLHLTLCSLLSQSVKADQTILWIGHADKDLLPASVLDLQQYGLTIRYCDDLKSYTKFVHTLKAEPDAFIVVADDDLHYPEDWLKKLVAGWNGDMDTIVAWRAHKIRLDQQNMPIAYNDWDWAYDNPATVSELLFPTSGFGTLYPPKAFHHDVLDTEKFMALAPKADDVWLYWMSRLNGKKTKVVGERSDFINWLGSQDEALWQDNVLKGLNDVQIGNMIRQYGWPCSA